uniref:Uncharacterized protein n=1 Tax=Hyaloperonospora arabidopsidis (strain Emoy2) TaxID=559515 RepID=M4BPX0_HYAAE
MPCSTPALNRVGGCTAGVIRSQPQVAGADGTGYILSRLCIVCRGLGTVNNFKLQGQHAERGELKR